jgi:hypothetical protein
MSHLGIGIAKSRYASVLVMNFEEGVVINMRLSKESATGVS